MLNISSCLTWLQMSILWCVVVRASSCVFLLCVSWTFLVLDVEIHRLRLSQRTFWWKSGFFEATSRQANFSMLLIFDCWGSAPSCPCVFEAIVRTESTNKKKWCPCDNFRELCFTVYSSTFPWSAVSLPTSSALKWRSATRSCQHWWPTTSSTRRSHTRSKPWSSINCCTQCCKSHLFECFSAYVPLVWLSRHERAVHGSFLISLTIVTWKIGPHVDLRLWTFWRIRQLS